MSSEENKSKSEKINPIDSNEKNINYPEINLIEETPTKDKQHKENSSSSKSNKRQKAGKKVNSPNEKLKFMSTPQKTNSPNENNKSTYFHSEKINDFEKKEISERPCCSCTKTKCIKKYCECYAGNKYCKDCHCIDCQNKFIYFNNSTSNKIIKDSSENERTMCTCSKSNCNKKYCECYKSGKKCNEECRCSNCLNMTSPSFTIHSRNSSNLDGNNNSNIFKQKENKANLLEEKTKNKSSCSNNKLKEDYQIQRISIFIDQYQTLINVEKFSEEDMRLISKKRLQSK